MVSRFIRNYNPLKFDDETRLRHLGVQPELRLLASVKFNGHFLGLHGHYAKYNVGGMSFLSDNMEHVTVIRDILGGGISYVCQWLPRQPLESGGCTQSRICARLGSFQTILVPHVEPFRKVRRKTTSAQQSCREYHTSTL